MLTSVFICMWQWMKDGDVTRMQNDIKNCRCVILQTLSLFFCFSMYPGIWFVYLYFYPICQLHRFWGRIVLVSRLAAGVKRAEEKMLMTTIRKRRCRFFIYKLYDMINFSPGVSTSVMQALIIGTFFHIIIAQIFN